MSRLITAAILLATACSGDKKSNDPPPSTTTPAEAPETAISKRELADALRSANVVPPVGAFQVEAVSDSNIELTYLSDEGGTRGEVQVLATRLVVATVDVLKKRGKDPRRTAITADIFVAAPDGVSGGGRVAPLGNARYDRDADEVFFEAAPDAPFNPAPSGDPKVDAARIAVRRYALEAFPVWQGRNPGKCPRTLDELNQLARRGDSVDPWGRPFQMLCGDPASAYPIAVVSYGPDGQGGTDDDIRSWE